MNILPNPSRTIYDVQQDLDLDSMLEDAVPPPTCEWQTKHMTEPCGSPATWIMSLSCGHSFYYDDEHAGEMKNAVERPGRNACNAPFAPKHDLPMVITIRFDRIAR